MLIITQGSVNNLVVTLYEKQTGTTKTFLCEFINKASSEAYYSLATNVSDTTRNEYLCITDTGLASANPLNSEVYLPSKGQYYYNIYESPNSSLNPSGLNLCENGRLLVIGDDIIIPAYSPEGESKTVFYNPK